MLTKLSRVMDWTFSTDSSSDLEVLAVRVCESRCYSYRHRSWCMLAMIDEHGGKVPACVRCI
jgi:hypothetical protein